MAFFKDYLEGVGGLIPTEDDKSQSTKSCPFESKPAEKPQPPPEEPQLVESDVELDVTGVIGNILNFSYGGDDCNKLSG